MSVGSLQEFEAALYSKNPERLLEAWNFYNSVEKIRIQKNPEFDTKLLAQKRIKILQACLSVCQNGNNLKFFGTKVDIEKKLRQYQNLL
jgi:hypothetical protein